MNENEVTQAEITASIIEGKGNASYIGATKVISLRLPLFLEAEIQAFAHKSGKTRNGMVAMLLKTGIEQVKQHLSDEVLEEIQELMQERLADGLAEGAE
jgi:predicted DNA-binding protein